MSSPTGFPARTITRAAVPILVIVAAAVPARAQNSAAGYVLLVASGFLCDPGDASTCPAVVKSAQGDSYEMSGAGTFSPESKSVTATGTFTHRSADGNALETGIWIANEFVSYDSYGIAPGARLQVGSAFGPPQLGLRRMPMLTGSMPTGGLAVLRISLLPMWGPSRTATLQVNCALGKVPEERQTEGIRLTFERGGEFDQEISGRTIFVSTRLGASPAPKPQTRGGQTNPAPAQAHQ
jgi:hypothetical protein